MMKRYISHCEAPKAPKQSQTMRLLRALRALAMTVWPQVVILSVLLFVTGCGGVTYPKEMVKKSVIKLCRDEYKIAIDANLVGNTLAIYVPLDNLFDITFVSDDAWDKISDVLLCARRVSLSTDAEIRFYCVITQDVRFPELQLVIVNYVDDVKRVLYSDISRGEYFKRTLRDLSENPQARKEQAIVNVFERLKLDKELQDKVLDDFFRSPPTSLEGFGYWNGKFYIKDITFEDFLAQQMASRIRTRFTEEDAPKEHGIRSVMGEFLKEGKTTFFLIDFKADTLLFVIDSDKKTSIEKEIFVNVFEEISNVIYGYKFEDFDLVKIIEKNTQRKFLISKEDIYLFKKRRLGIDNILRAVQ